MAFDGSGTFVRLYDWEQDAIDGIDIDATRMDLEMDGMATALSLCFLRDGSVAMQDDIDMADKYIVNIGDGAAATPSVRFSSSGGLYYSGGICFSLGGSKVATMASASFDHESMIRAKGLTIPSTGTGIELGYSTNVGYVGVIDRATSTYKGLNLRGSTVAIAPNGTSIFSADPSGIVLNPGGSTVMTITSLGVAITGIATIGAGEVVHTASTNKLPYAALVNTAGARILGAASATSVSGLTGTQATALLDLATASLKGLAPAFPNNTTTFLRGDGSYATPPGASWTTLATLTPSGSAASLGVDLTGYTDVFITVSGASSTAGTPSLGIFKTGAGTPFHTMGGSTTPAASNYTGCAFFTSKSGLLFGFSHDGTTQAPLLQLTATTSIFFQWSGGNFDAGTIVVYGRA